MFNDKIKRNALEQLYKEGRINLLEYKIRLLILEKQKHEALRVDSNYKH